MISRSGPIPACRSVVRLNLYRVEIRIESLIRFHVITTMNREQKRSFFFIFFSVFSRYFELVFSRNKRTDDKQRKQKL